MKEGARAKLDAHLWERHPDEWYVEPVRCTRDLLAVEAFPGGIVWDPTCGRGHVLQAATRAGYEALGTDKVDRTGGASWFAGCFDFLAWDAPSLAPAIIFNPPYGEGVMLEACIRKALSLDGLEKLAAFVPARFLWSQRRAAGLWRELPPTVSYVIATRPSCPPGPAWEAMAARGESPSGDTKDYAWCVWEHGDRPREPLRWLP